ncbi:MAG: membrane dipeptidase [Gemmatimonadetes bacterium]|nr:membrane dipeptidase [Gemmatimonadota bacterium]
MRTAARALSVALITAATSGCVAEAQIPAQDPQVERVKRILSQTPLIDGHNDLPWAIRNFKDAPRNVAAYDLRQRTPGHTDLARLRAGMVGGQFWSVFIPFEAVKEGAAKVQLEQIDIVMQVIARYPDHFELARAASDIERVFGAGRIASLLGMEGGHAIENSLGALRAFYDLGARYLTLTHSGTLDWADAATDSARHGGLTRFGEEVVREMNRLGMLVDLSHTSPGTMSDALNVARAPVIFSHSSARALTDHVRNVPDSILRRLPENGGVVMVTFVPGFTSEAVRTHRGPGPAPRATLKDVANHIEHIREVAGVDHVGIGSDFDGIDSTPEGLEDVSRFPDLFAELARRGWTDEELRKLAGQNLLRVMHEVERVARILQRERGPSTATIGELDAKRQ